MANRLTAAQLHALAELSNGPLNNADAMIHVGRQWRTTLFALMERGLVDTNTGAKHGVGRHRLTDDGRAVVDRLVADGTLTKESGD